MFMRKGNKYISNKSLDSTFWNSQDGKKITIKDTLIDRNSAFVSKYEEKESYEVIREIVDQLPERTKDIIIKYFGFIDDHPMRQVEIADELGISQSYVSKIIKTTLKCISIQLKILGIIEIPRKVKTKKCEN